MSSSDTCCRAWSDPSPSRRSCRRFRSAQRPDAKLGYFKMGLQSFVYYTDRGGVEEIGILGQAKAFFYDDQGVMGPDGSRRVAGGPKVWCRTSVSSIGIRYQSSTPSSLTSWLVVRPKTCCSSGTTATGVRAASGRARRPHPPILGSHGPSASRRAANANQTTAGNAGTAASARFSQARNGDHDRYATTPPTAATM